MTRGQKERKSRPPAEEERKSLNTLARVSLECFRIMEKQWGNDLETAKVSIAMLIGNLEGKPMDHSAIAAFTDVPRSTVLRKLKNMEESGQVTYEKSGHRRTPELTEGHEKAVTDVVIDTARHAYISIGGLSNLDSFLLEQ